MPSKPSPTAKPMGVAVALVAGIGIGAVGMWTLDRALPAFGAASAHGYRCDELARQADERDVLFTLGQASLTGTPVDQMRGLLTKHGLLAFEKPGSALVAHLPENQGPVTLQIIDDRIGAIEISGVDGRCPPLTGGS